MHEWLHVQESRRGKLPRVSAYLVLSPYDTEDEPLPHPELVRAQRPTAAQVTEAAGILGLLPDGSYLAGDVKLSLLTPPRVA